MLLTTILLGVTYDRKTYHMFKHSLLQIFCQKKKNEFMNRWWCVCAEWAGSVSSIWKTRFYSHLHTWSNHATDHLLLGKSQSVSRSVVLGLCRFSWCWCWCCSHTLGLQLCQAQLFTCLQIFILTLRTPMSLQDQIWELYCRSDRFYRIWMSVYLYLIALHHRRFPHMQSLWFYDYMSLLQAFPSILCFPFLISFRFQHLPLFYFLLLV